MIIQIGIGKEIFDKPKQADDLNFSVQFLDHFSFEGLFGALAKLGSATGKGPKIIACGLMQENFIVAKGNANHAIVETIVVFVETYHRARSYINRTTMIIKKV